jgi:hypothetical protein
MASVIAIAIAIAIVIVIVIGITSVLAPNTPVTPGSVPCADEVRWHRDGAE